MNRLRIIPLDEEVVFPGMPVTLPVDVGGDAQVLLVPRQQNTYARVGVVAEVSERVRLAGRGLAVSLMALHRAIPGGASADQDAAGDLSRADRVSVVVNDNGDAAIPATDDCRQDCLMFSLDISASTGRR